MSARIFVHPRCYSGQPMAALDATLRAAGYDTAQLVIGPESPRGHCELVVLVEEAMYYRDYRCLDGTEFRQLKYHAKNLDQR